MGQHIGYARVSTNDQDLSLQINELKASGCEPIFTDKVSGAKSHRPGLDDCLKTLRAGDTLVVWRLDRLGRSMQHLVSVVTDLKERGIGFRSLRDGAIDTTSASGELIFRAILMTPLPTRGCGRNSQLEFFDHHILWQGESSIYAY